MKQVTKPEEFPDGPHYVVIEFHTVTEDSGWGADNNSRVSAPHVYVTTDDKDWKDHVQRLEENRAKTYSFVPYVALVVSNKATVKRTIEIS